MTLDCLSEEALAEVASVSEADARRAHAESCPRCGPLLSSAESALAARSFAPFGSAPFAGAASQPDPGPDYARPLLGPRGVVRHPHPPPSLGQRLLAPQARPAWALTVLALLIGGYLYWPQVAHVISSLRASARPPAPEPEWVARVQHLADGGAQLSWNAVSEAETYQVRFYAASFDELDRIDAGSETALALPWERMPRAYQNGEVLLVRVYALQGSDEVRMSAAESLSRP